MGKKLTPSLLDRGNQSGLRFQQWILDNAKIRAWPDAFLGFRFAP
jgi:hypothetical protein